MNVSNNTNTQQNNIITKKVMGPRSPPKNNAIVSNNNTSIYNNMVPTTSNNSIHNQYQGQYNNNNQHQGQLNNNQYQPPFIPEQSFPPLMAPKPQKPSPIVSNDIADTLMVEESHNKPQPNQQYPTQENNYLQQQQTYQNYPPPTSTSTSQLPNQLHQQGPTPNNNFQQSFNQQQSNQQHPTQGNNYLHQHQNFSPPASTSTTPIPTQSSNQLYQQTPNPNNNFQQNPNQQSNQQHPTQENNYLHQHQNFPPSASTSTTPIPTLPNQLYQQGPNPNNNFQHNSNQQSNQQHPAQENTYLHQQQTHQNYPPSKSNSTTQLPQQTPNPNNNFQQNHNQKSNQQHPTQGNNYIHQQQTYQNFSPPTSTSTTPISTQLPNQLYQQTPNPNNNFLSKGNESTTYGNHTTQNAHQEFYNQQYHNSYENYSSNSNQAHLRAHMPGQHIHGQQSSEVAIGPDGNPLPSLLTNGSGFNLFEKRTTTPDSHFSMSSTGSRSSLNKNIRLLIDEKNEKLQSMTSLTLEKDDAALQKYADAARKLNDPSIQMNYVKFLINMMENRTKPNETDNSESVEKDSTTNKFYEEIKTWIDLLVKNNYHEALYTKGTWHEYGKFGKKVNLDKAFKLYLSSSKLDFPKASYKVAQHHEKNRDVKRAIQFYKKGAANGDVPSLYRLAQIYIFGDLKQTINYIQALIYLKQAVTKVNEECPEVAYVYGLILAKQYERANIPDDIVSPDDSTAKTFIQKAANLGYGPALYKMGHCYEYKQLTCPFDPLLSISYYKRAAEMGETKADLALSRWYLCGAEGYFDPDESLAYEHAEKAASKGIAEAEFVMGYFYDMGIHVTPNPQVANEWYTKAAEKGNEDAKKRLANGGIITRKDYEEIELKKKSKDCIIQ
ncbi:7359_t:CDS:2 [Entrophospora sp. SA101]|nr:7359_t:CDS:2 [Entrophospora sp. SA101]